MPRLVCLSFSTAAVHASNSARSIRRRPHAVYTHNASASSSIDQCTVSHGKPFLLESVATLAPLILVRPPFVAPQSALLESKRNWWISPAPRPSLSDYTAANLSPEK